MSFQQVDTRFRCSSPAGDDLCLNNGTCLISSEGGYYCACPPGWNPDYLNFHFSNCALPDHALLIFLILVALQIIVLLYRLMVVRRKAKGAIVKVFNLSGMICVFIFLEALLLYLEGGFFIGFSIVFCFTSITCCYWAYCFNRILVIPAFSIHGNLKIVMERRLKLTFSLIAVALCIVNVLLAIFAYHKNSTMFNTFQVVFNFLVASSILLYMSVMFISSFALEHALKHTENHLKERVLLKLKNIRKGTLSLGWGVPPSITVVAVYFAIGSFPYAWIYIFIMIGTLPISLCLPTFSLIEDKQQKLETDNAEPNNSSLVVNGAAAAVVHDTSKTDS